MSPFLDLMITSFIQGCWKAAFHWKLKFTCNTEISTLKCLLLLKLLFIEKNYYATDIWRKIVVGMDFKWHANNWNYSKRLLCILPEFRTEIQPWGFWGFGFFFHFLKMIRRKKVVAGKVGKLISFSISLLTKAIWIKETNFFLPWAV